MRDKIQKELEKIEKQHQVKILYAVESGSRGWGFESTDSDYDVRFIYIHKPEWYLSIRKRRDVIELPIDDLLDINGWDIKKALKLFLKSNPSLMEWMSSPIVYKQHTTFIDELKVLLQEYFESKSAIYHYLHMARRNYREYLKGERVKLKKYFYVIRPIFACMWIEAYGTQPPMAFEDLMDGVIQDQDFKAILLNLLEQKRAGTEFDEGRRIDALNTFLEEKIEYYETTVQTLKLDKSKNVDKLDQLFQDILVSAHA